MIRFVLVALALATPALAQGVDTALFTPKREVRFGASNISLKRAVSMPGFGNSYTNANLGGLELLTMGADGGGLRVRYETGTISGGASVPAAGKMENLVGSLIMGHQEFALVGGYRLTRLTWNGERSFHMPEVGLEGGKNFAGAGTLVKAAVTYRRMLTESKSDSLILSGLEARTSVLYVPPRFPVYVELGYRRDVSNFANPAKVVVRREEASAVIISIGLQAGLSAR